MRLEQEKDDYCRSLDLGDTKGKSEYFRDEDGFIYRRGKNGESLLVVPASLVSEILALNYDYLCRPPWQKTHVGLHWSEVLVD
jgi:hypothetical protein